MSPERILVPVDFNECSKAAVRYACDTATQTGASIYLLHVDVGTGGAGRDMDATGGILERLAALLSADEELSLNTVKAVVSGNPANAICTYAEKHNIDLIVMGTHGRSGWAHLTLGSVAERVLRRSHCPVVVLRSNGSIRRAKEAITALTKAFGNSHAGSRTATLQQFGEELQRTLQISKTTADTLLEQLEQNNWIAWSSPNKDTTGKWRIVSDAKELEPVTFDYSDSPGLDLVDRARKLRATDVHVDPVSGGEYLVRMRIDGKLGRYCTLSRNVAEHLVNRLKILAHLDIADPFRPKEGRLILPPALAELEVRMTTVPVADGEAVALRVFSKDSIFFNLDELGFSADSFTRVVEMIQCSEGLVLVTGPTGSGKSTTVYSILHSLTGDERVIVSIEDPVEFSVPFVRQMNVDPRHGTSMVEGLRTILRMDPDAIFVGEIRDPEAADIAMRAASSGRYVLSTLHTRNVASTVTSLRDLGITDRSISANLTGVVNQRLQRRLCPECKAPVEPDDNQKRTFEQHQVAVPEHVFTRNGCPACRETGYHGRVGVFETALINDDVKAAIAAGRPEFDIQQLLKESGMRLLMTDALQKASDGITDFDEAIHVHWLG